MLSAAGSPQPRYRHAWRSHGRGTPRGLPQGRVARGVHVGTRRHETRPPPAAGLTTNADTPALAAAPQRRCKCRPDPGARLLPGRRDRPPAPGRGLRWSSVWYNGYLEAGEE